MLKKILITFVSLISLIVLVASTLFAYLQFADLNRFKPQISQRLTQYLGRSVVIDGEFDINLIPLSLSLSDAKIANTPWGSKPNMLRVHQLNLQLGLLALLSGELLIYKFVLDDVQVLVEHNEQGENNWRLRESRKSPASTEKASKESTVLPMDFVTDVEIDIRNITLSYSQSPASPRREFALNRAILRGLSDRNALHIDIAGQIDGYVYQLNGQTGILADLLSSGKSFPVDLQAQALDTDWEIKGEIHNTLKLERIRLEVKTRAKDLTAWQQLLGVSIKKGPVNIKADIDGDLHKLSVMNMFMQVGNTEANGDVTLDLSNDKPGIGATLKVKDLHIKEFIDAIQPEAVKKDKDVNQVAEEALSEKELDLSFLNLFDASVQLSAESVGYEEWIVEQMTAAFYVKDGQLSLKPLAIASKLGEANGSFGLTSEQGVNIATLQIDAKDLVPGKFYDMASTYQGIGALHANIHTKGKSLTDLYSNLQGDVTGHYINKDHKHETKISLKRSSSKASDASFDVAIDGKLQKVPYKIIGTIGGPSALIADNPYPVTALLQFLNVNAKAKGTIGELFEAKGFDIDVDARTDNLGKLEKTLDIGLPALKKAQVTTVFRGDYSLLKFEHITAKTSNARLSGNIDVDVRENKPKIIGNLDIDQFDWASIQKEMTRPKKEESGKAQKSTKEKKLALTETMSFSALHDFNMDIKLKADNNSRIILPQFAITKLTAELTVMNSAFSVSQFNIETPLGSVETDFKIDAKGKVPVIAARLKTGELDLEKIESDNEEQLFWNAVAGADLSLRAQGDSLQNWLESISGVVTINYQQKQTLNIYELRLARQAKKVIPATPVSVRINSRVGETTFLGLGSVSAPNSWVNHDQPTELDFKVNVKGFVAEVQGKIGDIVNGEGMDVRVSFNNAQALAGSLGQNDLANRIGKVQVTSDIKGSYSSIVASQLKGVIGEGRITGTTTLNWQEQPPALEFDLNVDDLDISNWAEEDTKPKATKDRGKEKGGKLFSSQKLPFELLEAANINGAIKGNNIQFNRVKAQEVQAGVNLKDGALRLNVSRFKTADGSLHADLNIDTKTTPPRISLELNIPKINMAEFARNTAAEGLVKGNFGAEIAVNSAGSSMADLVADLDGYIRLLIDEGAIDSALFDIYTGGFRAMVGMLTVKKEKSTKINCGICGLKFDKGKGVTEVALLDTKHSTLVAEGWLDFNNETFSLKASPVSKGVSLNMDLPVIIQGSFSDPKFSTEPTSALMRAADIATVWFIPSTAIFIGYDELRTSDNNPCVNMVAPSKESAGLRTIKGAGKAFQDIGSAFNKSLSKILGGKAAADHEEENTSDAIE